MLKFDIETIIIMVVFGRILHYDNNLITIHQLLKWSVLKMYIINYVDC